MNKISMEEKSFYILIETGFRAGYESGLLNKDVDKQANEIIQSFKDIMKKYAKEVK